VAEGVGGGWVGLPVCLLKRRFLPLVLLVKDVDCLLKLCESCSFSFNVLPPCFGPLGHCLPFGDGLLLLAKSLDLMLYSSQLLIRNSFIL
jgi:hypothetical protein